MVDEREGDCRPIPSWSRQSTNETSLVCLFDYRTLPPPFRHEVAERDFKGQRISVIRYTHLSPSVFDVRKIISMENLATKVVAL